MAIFHLSVKTISRSAGRSATAAIAYRSASRIVDERTGITHNYARRSGVEHSEIFLPQDSPEWASNRQSLWNAVELKENRKNSTVAREFEIAFPSELNSDQRKELLRDFSSALVERHGMAVDAAIHSPGKEGDSRNYHAHVLCSTRRLTPEGFKDKTRELDDFKSGEVNHWRSTWADMVNQHLEKSGISERVDHRSLEAQRHDAITKGDNDKAAELDRVPTIHIGYAAAQMEKRGIESARGTEHREIVLRNRQIKPLSKAINLLENWRATHDTNGRTRNGIADPITERETGRATAANRTAIKPNIGRIGAEPPPSSRGRLRNLSELDMVRFEKRSEVLLPRDVSSDVEHKRTSRDQPVRRANDVTSQPKSPKLARLEWQKLQDEKFRYVRDKAERIVAKGEKQVERQREKITNHESQRPEQPKGLLGMFKRNVYEQTSQAWESIKTGLDRRLVQLKGRIGQVSEYMKKSSHYEFSSKGERLAEKLASKAKPELAKQIKTLDAQKKEQDIAAYRERLQSRNKGRGTVKQQTEQSHKAPDAQKVTVEPEYSENEEMLSAMQNEALNKDKNQEQSSRDKLLERFKAKVDNDRSENKGRGR